MMIKDVIYFNNFCYFIKKKYVLKSLEKTKKIIKLAPTYFMDVLSYNKNFTVKDIIGEYNRSYKECFNHNVALEDAICYAVDNILDLYDNNLDELIHNNSDIVKSRSIIILSVPPQNFRQIGEFGLDEDVLVFSFFAGISIDTIKRLTGSNID